MTFFKKSFDFETNPVNWLGILIISGFVIVGCGHFLITMPAGHYPHLWTLLSAIRISLVIATFLSFGLYIGVLLLPKPSIGIAVSMVLAVACTYNPALDLLQGVKVAEMDEVRYGFEEVFDSSSEYSFSTHLIPKATIVFTDKKSGLLEIERQYFESHWDYCASQGATPHRVHYLRHLEVLVEVECGGSGVAADVKDFVRSRKNCLRRGDALSCHRAGRNFEQGIAVKQSTEKADWFFSEACRLGFMASCKAR